MLVYIGHAVGTEPIKRANNILRVQRWFRWLIDFGPESWAFGIPWLPYVQNLDEASYRERGIRDGQEMLETFEAICLVGGEDTRRSIGAQAEKTTMIQLKRGVCDLTFLGDEPPTNETWRSEDPYREDPSPMTRENVSRAILGHLHR